MMIESMNMSHFDKTLPYIKELLGREMRVLDYAQV